MWAAAVSGAFCEHGSVSKTRMDGDHMLPCPPSVSQRGAGPWQVFYTQQRHRLWLIPTPDVGQTSESTFPCYRIFHLWFSYHDNRSDVPVTYQGRCNVPAFTNLTSAKLRYYPVTWYSNSTFNFSILGSELFLSNKLESFSPRREWL
jgi:hypothetical protein